MMRNIPPFAIPQLGIPQEAGIALKPQHYALLPNVVPDAVNATLMPNDTGSDVSHDIPIECDVSALFAEPLAPAWVEVHPQNYMGAGGPPHRWLSAVAAHYPLSFHSTALSLGSASGCDKTQLAALAKLVQRYNPALISDHLSWSEAGGTHFPDLLPLPMTHASLALFADQISYVQDALQRPIGIENPSRYVAFAGDDFEETEFLHSLCRITGCWLLLDVNNVLVSATNLGFCPHAYIKVIDPAFVQEVHLAGHAVETHADGVMLIDDHGSSVSDATWALYNDFIARAGPRPTLIEWDSNVPDYTVLMAEATKANAILKPYVQGALYAA
jgi:uncharacterized protein